MTNRVRIDMRGGTIELEGERDFVETQLDKLLPLVEANGFGHGTHGTGDEVAADVGAGDGDSTSAKNEPVAKKSRRGLTKPPKGHSCADRLMTLRADGFFKEQKTPSQIVDGLGKSGWTHASNQVSAAAGQMFKRGDIQRTKAGSGFAYFWDRE